MTATSLKLPNRGLCFCALRSDQNLDFVCISNLDRHMPLTERNLEVKIPTIWTDGNAEVGRVRDEKSKSQKKEGAGARKGRKVTIPYVFNHLSFRRVDK